MADVQAQLAMMMREIQRLSAKSEADAIRIQKIEAERERERAEAAALIQELKEKADQKDKELAKAKFSHARMIDHLTDEKVKKTTAYKKKHKSSIIKDTPELDEEFDDAKLSLEDPDWSVMKQWLNKMQAELYPEMVEEANKQIDADQLRNLNNRGAGNEIQTSSKPGNFVEQGVSGKCHAVFEKIKSRLVKDDNEKGRKSFTNRKLSSTG